MSLKVYSIEIRSETNKYLLRMGYVIESSKEKAYAKLIKSSALKKIRREESELMWVTVKSTTEIIFSSIEDLDAIELVTFLESKSGDVWITDKSSVR